MTTQDLMKLADKFAFFMPGSEEGEKARQALLDALEALGREVARLREVNAEQYGALDLAARECTTLRAELAAIRAQEPVAVVESDAPGGIAYTPAGLELVDGQELYASPIASPDVVALMDAELASVFVESDGFLIVDASVPQWRLRELVRAAITQAQAARVPDASPAAKDAGMVADGYPCEIEEADFEANTVTLKMMTSNYQVSAGKYLLKEAPKIGGV